jgi:hypothetical protein
MYNGGWLPASRGTLSNHSPDCTVSWPRRALSEYFYASENIKSHLNVWSKLTNSQRNVFNRMLSVQMKSNLTFANTFSKLRWNENRFVYIEYRQLRPFYRLFYFFILFFILFVYFFFLNWSSNHKPLQRVLKYSDCLKMIQLHSNFLKFITKCMSVCRLTCIFSLHNFSDVSKAILIILWLCNKGKCSKDKGSNRTVDKIAQ